MYSINLFYFTKTSVSSSVFRLLETFFYFHFSYFKGISHTQKHYWSYVKYQIIIHSRQTKSHVPFNNSSQSCCQRDIEQIFSCFLKAIYIVPLEWIKLFTLVERTLHLSGKNCPLQWKELSTLVEQYRYRFKNTTRNRIKHKNSRYTTYKQAIKHRRLTVKLKHRK